MALTQELKSQLKQYFTLLQNPVVFKVALDASENSAKVKEFIDEVVTLSDKLSQEVVDLPMKPSFAIDKADQVTGIVFAGLPMGHEFESFVLAVLQVGGHPPKISQEQVKRIASIKGPVHYDTYVSLTCNNCPEVVQSFNIIALLNEQVSHTMIEGGMFQEHVESMGIMAVPTVMKDGQIFASGRMVLDDVLDLILGDEATNQYDNQEVFDELIIGGGPAGVTAAIYAARKGIRTGLITDEIGGQVLETSDIANISGLKHIEGEDYAKRLSEHAHEYDIVFMERVRADKVERNNAEDLIEVTLTDGSLLKSQTVTISTGARWRSINVPGEQEFKQKGIAFCVHCDGPLFTGKSVAVIGGGNSGVEAAIDLANIVEHVTLIEFADTLKADQVLQDKLGSLGNVTIVKNAATQAIIGNDRVEGLIYQERESGQEHQIDVSGVFILIGLMPNTEWVEGGIAKNKFGEIEIDRRGATNIPGIFAAGDCTNVPHKQIVISQGAGATAALSAFDYLIRK